MNGQERRNAIMARLREACGPISAGKLAEDHGVTRQIIVADIALLRAAGHRITAVNRGYILESAAEGLVKRIAVKHGGEDVLQEFYAIVDNGGKVLDVIIEHSIYGRISVDLNIASRYDADEFVSRMGKAGANPLSLLTEGLHIHTLAVRDEETFARILRRLSELGILIESM